MKRFNGEGCWALFCAFLTAQMISALPAPAQILPQVKTVFVIGMENHNFTQPSPTSSPQQILNNPAAPYINSLITAGNSNAAQVSYCTAHYNVGIGVHPSEPNYIWSEAGTDFGVHTSNDPSSNSSNIFTAPHLTAQLNAAGMAWKNYQEDVQLASSPTISVAGTSSSVTNPYYFTGQYGYAAKHNPMVFFSDTQTQNVFPLSQLGTDLAQHAVGRYNWITPNLYNDQHTPLNGSFNYGGVTYTGDQEAVAQGDNFLSIVIPRIMASSAYLDHGLIIIRWDETEGGDTTNYTMPEILISPLARGNAYASSVVASHASELKTMEEIFGFTFLTNAIPSNEPAASGSGYNYLASVNDLSDLFQSAPVAPTLLSGQVQSNGALQLTFTGPIGQTYAVLASLNLTLPLTNWTVLGRGTFGAANASFLDNDATNHSARFYAIKSP